MTYRVNSRGEVARVWQEKPESPKSLISEKSESMAKAARTASPKPSR